MSDVNEVKKLPVDTVVNGRELVTVTKFDGTKMEVAVLLLPVSKAGDYLKTAGDLSKFIALVTGKGEDFADTLEPDSVFKIDEVARKINADFIDRLISRQRAILEKMVPAARELSGSMSSLGMQSPAA